MPLPQSLYEIPDIHALSAYQPIRPVFQTSNKKLSDPIRWLQENSNNRYAISESMLPQFSGFFGHGRPKAAIISLVRNSELEGMMQSMRQLEFRWNWKYKVIVLTTKYELTMTVVVPVDLFQRRAFYGRIQSSNTKSDFGRLLLRDCSQRALVTARMD